MSISPTSNVTFSGNTHLPDGTPSVDQIPEFMLPPPALTSPSSVSSTPSSVPPPTVIQIGAAAQTTFNNLPPRSSMSSSALPGRPHKQKKKHVPFVALAGIEEERFRPDPSSTFIEVKIPDATDHRIQTESDHRIQRLLEQERKADLIRAEQEAEQERVKIYIAERERERMHNLKIQRRCTIGTCVLLALIVGAVAAGLFATPT